MIELWEFWLAVLFKELITATGSQHKKSEVFVTTLTKMNA